MARKVKKGYLDPVELTKPEEISHVSMAEEPLPHKKKHFVTISYH
jgi:hypothetical protein